jgi:ABC-type transport system involved in cytochrome bd biosynthesis fused ATPase/permease subunit
MKALQLVKNIFLHSQDELNAFITLYCFKLFIGVFNSYCYSILLNSDHISFSIILPFIFSQFFEIQYDPYIQNRTESIIYSICKTYKEKELLNFKNNISCETKDKTDINEFNILVDKTCDSIFGICCWFIPNLVNVTISMTLSLMTFQLFESWILFLVVLLQTVTYNNLYSHKRSELSSSEEDFRSQRSKARNKLVLNLYCFDRSIKDYNTVKEQDTIIHNTWQQYSTKTRETNNIVSYTNLISLIIVVSLATTNIKAIIVALSSLNHSISNLLNSISWLSKNDSIITEFDEKKASFIYRPKPYQRTLKNNFTVTDIKIARKNKVVKYCSISDDLELTTGDRILICGPSGHGKTTFLKGLTGQLDGVLIDGVPTIEFSDDFMCVGQSLTNRLKFDKITLRELFEDASEEQIEKFLSMALLDEWMNKLKYPLNSDSFVSIDMNSWIDKQIEVSGGEHLRLTIAYNLYMISSKDHIKVIALDEPEQGTDLYNNTCQDSYEMVRRISDAFKNKTLIVISHNYDINGFPHVKKVYDSKRYVKWNKVVSLMLTNTGDMEVYVDSQ